MKNLNVCLAAVAFALVQLIAGLAFGQTATCRETASACARFGRYSNNPTAAAASLPVCSAGDPSHQTDARSCAETLQLEPTPAASPSTPNCCQYPTIPIGGAGQPSGVVVVAPPQQPQQPALPRPSNRDSVARRRVTALAEVVQDLANEVHDQDVTFAEGLATVDRSSRERDAFLATAISTDRANQRMTDGAQNVAITNAQNTATAAQGTASTANTNATEARTSSMRFELSLGGSVFSNVAGQTVGGLGIGVGFQKRYSLRHMFLLRGMYGPGWETNIPSAGYSHHVTVEAMYGYTLSVASGIRFLFGAGGTAVGSDRFGGPLGWQVAALAGLSLPVSGNPATPGDWLTSFDIVASLGFSVTHALPNGMREDISGFAPGLSLVFNVAP